MATKIYKVSFDALTLEWIQGKNEDIGLPKVENDVMATHPTVNSELYDAIRHGKVKPYGDIRNFDGKTVHFKDGFSQDFDVVIACTGFKIKHKFFDKALINFESGPVPLLHKMIPEKIKTFILLASFSHWDAFGLVLSCNPNLLPSILLGFGHQKNPLVN